MVLFLLETRLICKPQTRRIRAEAAPPLVPRPGRDRKSERLTPRLGEDTHLGALAYLIDENGGPILQGACGECLGGGLESGLKGSMHPNQAAATDNRKLTGIPFQKGVLAGIEETSFLLGGKHTPRVGASSCLVKKTRFSGLQNQILMPARGSLSSFFLRGRLGTALVSSAGADPVEAEAARRPPAEAFSLWRTRLFELENDVGIEEDGDTEGEGERGDTTATAVDPTGVGAATAASTLLSQALSLICACRSALAAASTAWARASSTRRISASFSAINALVSF